MGNPSYIIIVVVVCQWGYQEEVECRHHMVGNPSYIIIVVVVVCQWGYQAEVECRHHTGGEPVVYNYCCCCCMSVGVPGGS